MTPKKTEAKKPSLDEFLAKPKPVQVPLKPDENGDYIVPMGQPTYYDAPAPVKKGVAAAQTEKPVAKVAPVAPAPTPEKIIPAQEPVANPPVKQGGVFTPPAEPVAPQVKLPQPAEDHSVMERALIGATPLLVGLLTGNPMEGVQVAGDQLVNNEHDLQTRERDFNKKLNEMAMAKALKGPGSSKLQAKTFEYQGSDGRARIGRFINGEYYQDETTDPLAHIKADKQSWITKTIQTENGPREVAYNPVTRETQEIGTAYEKPQRQVVDIDENGTPIKAVANLTSGTLESKLGKMAMKPSAMENGKDERQIKQIRVGLLKEITKPNSSYSKSRDALEGMAKAAHLLNEGGPIGGSGLRLLLARSVFDEKGPLSDGDVSRMSGDPSGQALVSRIYDKFINGTINDKDRADIRKVVDIAAKLAKDDANRYLDGFIKTYKSEGYDLEPQLSNFRELPEMPGFKYVERKNQKLNDQAAQMDMPKAGTRDGDYEFIGGNPADKNSWKKVK